MDETSSEEKLKKKIADLEKTITFLNDRNEQLQLLMETVPEGIIFLNKTGEITFINSTLEKILGIESKQIVGSYYKDPLWHFPLADVQAAHNGELLFDYIMRTGETVANKEHIWKSADGKQIILSINAMPCLDKKGEIAGVIFATTDITGNYLVKHEAKEIKESYERLTLYADQAIFRTQADGGKIIYINEAAEKIFGYTLNEYLTDPFIYARSILPEYFPGWLKAVEEMKAGKDVIKNMLCGITAKDGHTVMMEFTAIAVRDENGKITHFESLGRDITVRRFLEQELAKAQKLESIGLLAGGIAHDFNNILTAILGSLSLAKLETKPTGLLYERLNQAEDHCLKAKALTRRLLTYSRRGNTLRKTASIAEILREAAGFAVSGKNNQCKFNIPDDLWPALIDEGQMHQIIHYLVINASEAMPKGGVIEIGAQNLVLEADQFPPLPAGNYIKWYVRDHGIGIPKEHMKKLFDPYFTTKQMGSIKGMGLGLAICHSLIKNHEGLINIESEPGMGTTVTIYIPAIDAKNGNDNLVREKEAPDQQKHKILLIDDEKILLDVTSSMLTHLGYEVTTAESHENALDIYCQAKNSNDPFSLIIMDLTMRGNEGGEIAIRKWLTIDPEVKAIISSGYVNDPVIENYQEYGFTGAMVKPYTLSDLKKSIKRILKQDNM